MKNQVQQDLLHAPSAIATEPISLHGLVNRIQASLLPVAIDKKSFIVNEVDEKQAVTVDENILAFIIGGLVSNAVCSTSNACIRVEAICGEKDTRIVIRNTGLFIHSPQMFSLTTIMTAARKLGGSISLQKEITGAFTVTLCIAAAA